jgi:hypothetical protein
MKASSSLSIPECSASAQESFAPSPYSKPYLMFTATDAASAAIDFAKGNVDDSIIDSPPSRGPVASPILSPSPLNLSQSTPIQSRSCSPIPWTQEFLQRQLYKCRELTIPSFGDERDPALRNSMPTSNRPTVAEASESLGRAKRRCLPRQVGDRVT